MTQILVTYASKYGTTAEIAATIADRLREEGFETELRPVEWVSDLASYDVVVIGSAVYIGQWRREAVKFLKENEDTLQNQMVWIFSSGPTGDGDPIELLKGWEFPERLRPVVERVDPESIAVFHGALDNDQLNMMERWIIRNVKAPVGDFRDWEDIANWAFEIAETIRESFPWKTGLVEQN